MTPYSRRRFLIESGRALGLVGGALGAGCSPDADTALERVGLSRRDNFTASFVGVRYERGHRLREPVAAAGMSEPRRTDVAIVGAGISGLAAARALAQAGVHDYRIFDLEDEAGGNSRAGTVMGIDCPWGAHYLPVPGDAAQDVAELLTELGLRRVEQGRAVYDEMRLCHSPQERLFIDGRWEEGILPRTRRSRATLDEYARFAGAVEELRRDTRFSIPTTASPWDPKVGELDAQTFDAWLRSGGYSSPELRWFLDYCCRDDYGAGLARVSAWAGLHYFASRHGFRPFEAEPESGDGVLTWPEGNAWLARRLAAPHVDRMQTASLVVRVEEARRDVTVDVLDARDGRRTRWIAKRVILAIPLFVAARVIRPLPPALQDVGSRLSYAPWLVANLYVAEPLAERRGQAPRSWDNVLYRGAGLGYVDASHQGTLPYPAATVLTYFLSLGDDPLAGRRLLLERSVSDWCEAILQDLAPAHRDLRGKVRQIDLVRYGHGMIVPAPGVRGDPALAALRESSTRVHYAHSDLSAYSVFEEAFHWGRQAGARTAKVLLGR